MLQPAPSSLHGTEQPVFVPAAAPAAAALMPPADQQAVLPEREPAEVPLADLSLSPGTGVQVTAQAAEAGAAGPSAHSAAEDGSAVGAESAAAADAATGQFLAGLGQVLEDSLQELSQLTCGQEAAWEADTAEKATPAFASAASSAAGTPRAPKSSSALSACT